MSLDSLFNYRVIIMKVLRGASNLTINISLNPFFIFYYTMPYSCLVAFTSISWVSIATRNIEHFGSGGIRRVHNTVDNYQRLGKSS